MSEAIGLDVGGTKTAAVRINEDGEVLAHETVATPADDAAAILATAAEAAKAVMTSDVVAVGAGVAGMVDSASGILRYSPNLAWRELPLRDRLAAGTGLPSVVDNDANVAAWGEFRFGAGKGTSDMLLVTVGTGIGGGLITGGRIFRGAHGFAGEIGHVIVDPRGPICGCGNRGCWEQMASGRAIDRLGREAVDEHPGSLLAELAGGDRTAVNGHLVAEAARRGDDTARRILADVGRLLGLGIAGLVNVLDPDVVVVGGGVVEDGELILGPARMAVRDAVEATEHRPDVPVLAAELGNDAGAVGAAALALEEAR